MIFAPMLGRTRKESQQTDSERCREHYESSWVGTNRQATITRSKVADANSVDDSVRLAKMVLRRIGREDAPPVLSGSNHAPFATTPCGNDFKFNFLPITLGYSS